MTNFKPPEWIEARSYQQRAIKSWLGAGGKGILQMATGTGKTVTSLLAAAHVANGLNGRLVLVISVPYQHLVDQWASDLKDFGAEPILAYQSRKNWQPKFERELLEFNNGIRNNCTVITTHRTLSNPSVRKSVKRASGSIMLIADEVHHLGANQAKQSLIDDFDLRLGLSATPERWFDEEGTEYLDQFFGGTIFKYGLQEAIDSGALCEYYYVPHIVNFDDDEMDEYLHLSEKIGKLLGRSIGNDGNLDLDNSPALQQALFKRARLVGTARQKLEVLVELLSRVEDPTHSLVYCSDGSISYDGSIKKRHIDVTTNIIRNQCNLSVNKFTAEEDQSEREYLLSEFEQGNIQILTSIKCLDEGVDVPATRTAYLLASTSNPRQYVQRRGRILRKHKNKKYAVIHDFITVPDIDNYPHITSDEKFSVERKLIKKELRRVSTFADNALNHPDADIDDVPTTKNSLQKIKKHYNLLTD